MSQSIIDESTIDESMNDESISWWVNQSLMSQLSIDQSPWVNQLMSQMIDESMIDESINW